MTRDTQQVNMHEAKTRLSELVAQVEQGRQIVIARNGKPVAVLSRFREPEPSLRPVGRMRDRIEIAPDFDQPDPEIEAMFYGDPD